MQAVLAANFGAPRNTTLPSILYLYQHARLGRFFWSRNKEECRGNVPR